jgi:hypothetical protein
VAIKEAERELAVKRRGGQHRGIAPRGVLRYSLWINSAAEESVKGGPGLGQLFLRTWGKGVAFSSPGSRLRGPWGKWCRWKTWSQAAYPTRW